MTVIRQLDHDWICAELARRRATIGRPLHYFEAIGSTSDIARGLAADGSTHGTTVLTDEQTAGRGRRGASRWQTPSCMSVALSIVLRPDSLQPAHLGRFGLCLGVAVAEAIWRSTGVDVAVKWPNDLVVTEGSESTSGTRKLGGILVEPAIVASMPARVTYLVVGIGINANLSASGMAPVEHDALPPVALVDVVGTRVSRERLIAETLVSVGAANDAWTDDLWPSWRLRYTARMAWRGARVAVDSELTPGARQVGRVGGVDDSGALVLLGTDGVTSSVVGGRVRLL